MSYALLLSLLPLNKNQQSLKRRKIKYDFTH